jgi:hypothetical protein
VVEINIMAALLLWQTVPVRVDWISNGNSSCKKPS